MTGTRRNRLPLVCISAIAILLILASPSLAPGASGQGPGIELVDSTGTELGARSFMASQVGFDTVDTRDGTRYLLSGNTEIGTIETYIKWVGIDSGLFDLRISVAPAATGSYGFLHSTGIRVAVSDGGQAYYAVLNQTNGFAAYVIQDDSENPPRPHSFQPGQDGNRIRVYTDGAYDSATAPTDALKLTFTFTIESEGLHRIQYVSEGEVVGTKMLSGDAELGEPPQVTRSGYDLLGWKDSNGAYVTPATKVSALPSDTITADWREQGGGGGDDDWPKVDTDEETVVEPDGTTVTTDTTTISYEDGTRTVIVEKVIDRPDGDETLMESITTTYPDRKRDTTVTYITETTHDDGSKDIQFEYEQHLRDGEWTVSESTETYDPVSRLVTREGHEEAGDRDGTSSRSDSLVEIEYHPDGTSTRTEKRTDEDRSGFRAESETVSLRSSEEEVLRESRDLSVSEPGRAPREYGVEYQITEEGGIMTATMPEIAPGDLETVDSLIQPYDFSRGYLGVSRDDGIVTVSDGMLPTVSEMGCGLYAHRGGESVSIDADIVAELAKGEGALVLRMDDAQGHMNPQQARAVGSSYAVSVTLAMGSEYVTELPGTAEIVLEPGYESADAFRVEEDGSLTRMDASYDPVTGAVSFPVGHLSIYMVELHSDDGPQPPWAAIGAAALAAIIAIMVIIAARPRGRDRCSTGS